MTRKKLYVYLWLLAAVPVTASQSATWIEPPMLADRVAKGELPPITQRLPARPSVVALNQSGMSTGQYGGDLRLLMGRSKDVRMMVVYGYARLVAYDQNYRLVPDILEDVDVKEGRSFTLRLRSGHRWSDGQPFTSEDFRYYWEDIVDNEELSPFGPPSVLLVGGVRPEFELVDETTVRYTWPKPNPFFLPALAGARPETIYAPAHYLKQFHPRYTDIKKLEAMAKAEGQRNWVSVHTSRFRPYKNLNPDLPTLQPWVNTTPQPSQRFVFLRNPYYHRVDKKGKQLPYIDRVIINVADGKLIPAKTGAGESDLQARNLSFSDYTFLKKSESRTENKVYLWDTTKGAHMALFPNLNVEDSVWRNLMRDVRFRRALSLAIDRHEINQVLYLGYAKVGNDTVFASSPVYKPEYQTLWAQFDLKKANALLDQLGLTQRNGEGIRLLPDGRPMTIIVETAGEDGQQIDILELIADTWLKVGIKLLNKPLQRELFRNRIYSGQTLVSVWGGLENGLPTADMSPRELAPTTQDQLQWPKWGQYYETSGEAGDPPDLPQAKELLRLNEEWVAAADSERREAIWHRMLKIRANQVFTIGIVSGVPQPIVANRRLRNCPAKGVYNWDPGAHFGIYRPDTFWFAKS